MLEREPSRSVGPISCSFFEGFCLCTISTWCKPRSDLKICSNFDSYSVLFSLWEISILPLFPPLHTSSSPSVPPPAFPLILPLKMFFLVNWGFSWKLFLLSNQLLLAYRTIFTLFYIYYPCMFSTIFRAKQNVHNSKPLNQTFIIATVISPFHPQ